MFHAQLSSAAVRTSASRGALLGIILAAGAICGGGAASGAVPKPRIWGWNGPSYSMWNSQDFKNKSAIMPLASVDVLKLNVSTTGENWVCSNAATCEGRRAAKQLMADTLSQDTRFQTVDNLAILIKNFGAEASSGLYTMFTDLLPNTNNLTDAQRKIKPWYTNNNTTFIVSGLSYSQDWMTGFTDELKTRMAAASPAIPAPERFHFDNEPGATTFPCCGSDSLVAFDAARYNDYRYSNSSYPVPGFGQTLSYLYSQSGALDYNKNYGMAQYNCCGSGSYDNRPFSRWFLNTYQQAASGALAASTAVMTGSSGWSGAKRSNYSDVRTDAAHPYYDAGPGGATWAYYSFQGQLELQSPVCYAAETSHFPNGTTTDADKWNASMSDIRRNIEACIESNGGGHQADVVPWINMPAVPTGDPSTRVFGTGSGQVIGSDCQQSYTPSADDMRRLLALLRSKDIGEMIMFNTDPTIGCLNASGTPYQLTTNNDTQLAWGTVDRLVSQVWGIDIASASVTTGTRVGSAPTVTQAVTFALKDPLQITSTSPRSGDRKAQVSATFATNSGFWVGASTSSLGIIVESLVDGSATGLIEIKRQDGSNVWDAVGSTWTVDQYGGTSFGQVRRVATPRSGSQYISSGGQIDLRVTHSSQASTFTSYFDLIQVVGLDYGSSFLTAPPKPRGVNGIATVLANLGNAGGEENPADINNDGVIDAKDIEALIGPASYLPNN